MNYYEHHLGDYDGATAHLSWLEDCAYRRLLCLYYRNECPVPLDIKQACRLVRAASKAERDAVQQVLSEFFEQQQDGWHHKRCDEEIARFQEKSHKARESVSKRWAKRDANQMPTHSERNTNVDTNVLPTNYEGNTPRARPQTPDTRHQTPEEEIPPNPRKRGRGSVEQFPPGFEDFWSAYPRKTSKPDAVKAFARLKPDTALLRKMLEALAAQSISEQWRKDGGQFIPHPATWLNKRRWEDEIHSPHHPAGDIFAGAM